MQHQSTKPRPVMTALFPLVVPLFMLLMANTISHSQSLGGPDNIVIQDSLTDTGAADTPSVHALRETGLELLPDGRKLLAYLISCAIPAGVRAGITVAGYHYEYPGSMGLAEGWLQGALLIA